MIFSEVIEQILFERGIDYKALATTLGISALQVKNLQSGATKMPSERICNLIIQYCKQYAIDIDINWNDVLYDIFLGSESFREYTWVRDLDEDGYVAIRHNACGRKTRVPKQAFAYRSTPCIHCWVEKYVSSDAYETDLSEDVDKHKFTHKCGHSYFVTYNEIKQKKFRCPSCTGYRYNADNLINASKYSHKSDDDIEPTATAKPIIERLLPVWDVNLKRSLDLIAADRGFSIEDRDSIHCRLRYPSMTDRQFAFICGTCFVSKVFEKKESVIPSVINFTNLHKCECEKSNDYFIENTKRNNLIWIPDVENIFRMTTLSASEDNPLFKMLRQVQGDEYSKETYIAGTNNLDDDKTTYLFYHYSNDNDSTDYTDFLVSLSPIQFHEMTFYSFPKTYTDFLYEQILLSMDQHAENSAALQRTCDEYADIINYFEQNNPQIFVYAILSKFADTVIGIIKKPAAPIARKEDAEKTLNMMHCPVCRSLHNSKAEVCTNCGFDELNKVFINKDEYDLWLNQVVLPARKKHEESK